MVYKRRRLRRRWRRLGQRGGSKSIKAAKVGLPWALMALNSLNNSLQNHKPKSQQGYGRRKQRGGDLLGLLVGNRKLGKIEIL